LQFNIKAKAQNAGINSIAFCQLLIPALGVPSILFLDKLLHQSGVLQKLDLAWLLVCI